MFFFLPDIGDGHAKSMGIQSFNKESPIYCINTRMSKSSLLGPEMLIKTEINVLKRECTDILRSFITVNCTMLHNVPVRTVATACFFCQQLEHCYLHDLYLIHNGMQITDLSTLHLLLGAELKKIHFKNKHIMQYLNVQIYKL